MASQTVIEGDCLAVMRTMPTASIHAVVSSFPYNFGVDYSLYRDNRPEAEYFDWVEEVAEELGRLVRADGHAFINVGYSREFPRRAEDVAMIFEQVFVRQQTITWVKSQAIDASRIPDFVFKDGLRTWAEENGMDLRKFPCQALRDALHDLTIGHYTTVPPQSHYLNPCSEPIFHFSHSGNSPIDRLAIGVKYVHKSNVKRFNHAKDLHCRGNVWPIPYDTRQGRADAGHPATFPLALAERCLRLAAVPSDGLALDPCMGIGTTLLAAQKLELNAIGIDIDPAYVAAARRRLGQVMKEAAD
jgi:site-specific DNA-methyltransferase (adenine-specific)